MKRLEKEDWYMNLAEQVSKRGTCDRAKVGAIIIKDGVLIGTGYNGTARGEKNCKELGCNSKRNCVYTIHAELNAIINCARVGVSTIGASLYCTHKPCDSCSRAIINAGITEVYYKKEYEGIGSIRLEDFIYVDKI